MNYKPDEATLIAYHYGELEGDERANVEAYLDRYPAERKRLEEWQHAREIMGHLRDKEVIAPPIVFGEHHRSFWQEGYVRMSLGIAASLLVVVIAARLLGMSASYKAGELRIGFIQPLEPTPAAAMLSEEKVAAMIQASLKENNNTLQASWNNDRKDLEQNIKENIFSNSERIEQLVQKVSKGQQQQVRQFVDQLQADNLKLMKDYLQMSNEGQKQYVETLLVDFSKYLQEQRKQDVQYFQAGLNDIRENTSQFKKETEQILTSLMGTGRNDVQRIDD